MYFNIDEVKVIEVIYCSTKRNGTGTEFDPIRVVEQIYAKDGALISENDPERIYTKEHLILLYKYLNPDYDLLACEAYIRGFVESKCVFDSV